MATAAPRREGVSGPMLALIIVLAVALLAVGGYFAYMLLSKNNTDTTTSSQTTATPSATATAPTVPVITVTHTETQTIAPPTQQSDPESQAYQNLENQVNTDLPQVQATIQDQWTNMLATKKVGTLADGSSWNYESIWSLYTSLKQQYPTALLIQGNTYTSTNLGPEWFNIASGIVFSNPDDALSWCSSHGYGGNDCFAFRFTDQPGTNAKHPG